jgi:hypothetical protein
MTRAEFAFCIALILAPIGAAADPAEAERQTQRALIQRDQQSAEFSQPRLRALTSRPDTAPLRSDERIVRAREREAYLLTLPPPVQAPSGADARAPLPLPGGPRHGVDPIPVQGVGG